MSDQNKTEAELNNYIGNYTDFNDWLIRQRYEHLKQYFKGKTCLELGPAHGEGTEYLLDYFEKVVAVDGSRIAIDKLKKRFPTDKLITVRSYFEDLGLDKKFDTIVLAHILEHVDDPHILLVHAKKFLKPDGIMIIDVPNGLSLHRQVGVAMSLLKEPTELNDADLSIGHQRVYTPATFRKEISNAGLHIDKFGGMFIKILSNAQTEKVFNEKQLGALLLVGQENPEIAAEIYIIGSLKS